MAQPGVEPAHAGELGHWSLPVWRGHGITNTAGAAESANCAKLLVEANCSWPWCIFLATVASKEKVVVSLMRKSWA